MKIISFNINDLYSDNWNQLSEYLSDKQISLIKDYIRVNGEINNMIAPVRSMIGDTMKLSYNTSDTQNHIYIVLD